MEVIPSKLKDVWLIKPNHFPDWRGDFIQLDKEGDYDNLPPKIHFVERALSISNKGVLRGMHYSPHCWKIYQCIQGALYYVFVNYDESDPEYGKQAAFILKPYDQLLKHPKYAAGMLALEDNTMLLYFQEQYYNAEDPDQQTFKWNDPRFNIWWPTKNPKLSQRDEVGETSVGLIESLRVT